MAKIKTMDRSAARELHVAFEKFLKDFGKDYGVVASCGNGRFDSRSVRFKVEITVAGAVDASSVADKAKADFEFYCSRFGLTKDDWGKRFLSRGKSYTICGISPSSYKYPILGKSPRGTTYKFTADGVLVGMGKNPLRGTRKQMWSADAQEQAQIERDFDEDGERDFGTPRED
jgi:hypothetical protein